MFKKKKKRKGLRKLAPAYVLRQTMKGARNAAGDLGLHSSRCS